MPEVPAWIREARAQWEYRGQVRPAFAEPVNGDRESVGADSHPLLVDADSREVVVPWNGALITKTSSAMLLAATCLMIPCFGSDNSRKPKTYPAGGTLTLQNGTLLAGARIEIQQVDNVAAQATVQVAGSFQLGTNAEDDGAVEGEHRVLIIGSRPERKRGWETGVISGGNSGEFEIPRINLRYAFFEPSTLIIYRFARQVAKSFRHPA